MIYSRVTNFLVLVLMGLFLGGVPIGMIALAQEPGTSSYGSHIIPLKGDAAHIHTSDNSFSNSYSGNACGLNYTMASAVLQQRYVTLRGVNQPADLPISNLPCADNLRIERAFLYWTVETNQLFGQTVRLTNPQGNEQTFPASEIGQASPGKCWGCNYTRTFRADVTSHITGNGTYRVQGLPVGVTCDANGGDTDGVLLLIVFRDLSATWQGHLRIFDGIMVRNNGSAQQNITGLSFCAPPTNARGFVGVADLQLNTQPVWTATINGQTHGLNARFFNIEERPVTLNQTQTSSEFGMHTAADCYAFFMAGLYWQTTGCQTCGQQSNFTVTGGASVCAGDASGPTLSFSGPANRIDTWEASTNSGASWTPLNVSTASYLPPVPAVTTWYRVRLTAAACPASFTNHTVITVTSPPEAGTLNGGGPACGNQAPPPLTLSGHTGTLSRWEVSTDCPAFTTFTTVAAAGPSWQPPPATAARCVRARITSGNCPAVTSGVVNLPWESDGPSGTLTGPTTVCSDARDIRLTLTNSSLTVLRWEFSANCPAFSSPQTIAHTQAVLDLPTPPPTTRCYRVIQAGAICAERASSVLTLSVEPASISGNLTGPSTTCPGNALTPLSLSGHQGNVVRWEESEDCFTSTVLTVLNLTSTSYTPPPLSRDRCWRVIVQRGNCPPVVTLPHRIEVVNSQLGGVLTPAQSSLCQGQGAPLLTLQGVSGTILRWERSTDSGQTWTSFAHTQHTYQPPNLNQTTWYRAISTGITCPELRSEEARIQVNPASVGGELQADRRICQGQTSGLLSLIGQQGEVVRWEQSTNGGQTWTPLALTLTSWTSGNLMADIRYRVVVQSGACPPATSTEARITVDEPTLGGEVSPDRTVCPNANSGLLTLNRHRGTVLYWERRVSPAANWTSFAHTQATYEYQNLGQTTEYRAIVANGTCDTLASTSARITVLNPPVPGQLGPAQTLCPGQPVQILNLTGHVGQIVRWETSIDGGQTWQSVNHTGMSWLPPQPSQTTRYRVALRTGQCPESYSPQTEVRTDGQRPNGRLGGTLAVCRGQNSGTLTLTNFQGTVIHWERSSDGGQSWTTLSQNATTLAYLNLVTETRYRVLLAFPPCPNEYSDTLVVRMLEPVSGGSVSGPARWCTTQGSPILTLSGHTGQVLHWEEAPDCQFAPPQTLSHSGATLNPTPAGNRRCYRAAIQGASSCPLVYSQPHAIDYDSPSPAGQISPDQSVCQGSEAVPITVLGINGQILFWEKSTDQFSSDITLLNHTQNSLSPDAQNPACYRAVHRTGICPPQRSPASCVSILPAPPSGAVTGADTICVGTSGLVLRLEGQQGQVIDWQASSDGFTNDIQTVLAGSSTTYTTGPILRRTCFRARVQAEGCAPLPSEAACITVDDSTQGGSVEGAGRWCLESQPQTLTLTGSRGSVLFWEQAADFSQNSTITFSHTDSFFNTKKENTTYCYRAWVQNGRCPSRPSAAACVIVDAASRAGSLSGPAEFCQSELPLTWHIAGHTGMVIYWERRPAIGPPLPLPPSGDSLRLPAFEVGSCLRAWVQQGSCPPEATDWFCPTVHQPPLAGTIIGPGEVCRGEVPQLRLVGFAGNILRWESSTDNFQQQILTLAGGTERPGVSMPLSRTCYRAAVGRGTCTDVLSLPLCVEVRQPPAVGTIAGAGMVCKGANSGALRLIDPAGLPLFWQISEDSLFGQFQTAGSGQLMLIYQNLTRNTWYRAVFAGDAVCPLFYTPAVQIAVVEPSINAELTPVRCAGEGNARIVANPSGGLPATSEPPYRIDWVPQPPRLSPDAYTGSELPPGIWCLHLTDGLGCRADTCIAVVDPPIFSVFINENANLSCFESQNGVIEIGTQGGVLPYRFTWPDGDGPARRNDLAAGSYSPTVTDANGCPRVAGPVVLTQPSPIVVNLSYIEPVRCAGRAEGAIGIHVSGGAWGFRYRWSNGATTEDVAGLRAGLHVLTITDQTGCVRIDSFIVPEPPPLQIETLLIREPTCAGGHDGRIEVRVTGGTPPYTWHWSRTTGNGPVLADARAGAVQLVVIDASGCRTTASWLLRDPVPLRGQVHLLRRPACVGQADGAVELSATGGTPPYIYRWFDGSQQARRDDLGAGLHAVTVSDARGCERSLAFELQAPESLRIVQQQLTPVRCGGESSGSISLYVAGGTPAYSFAWSNGGSTEDLLDLAAGSYSLTVIDARGCRLERTFTISEPAPLLVEAQGSPTRCWGGYDGKAFVQATGGTPPYTFHWSNSRNEALIEGLAAGSYEVAVTDGAGCQAFASVQVESPPPLQTFVAFWSPPTCTRAGRLELLTLGGTPPYLYQWSNGNPYSVIETEFKQTYSVTVTDANGCSLEASYTERERPVPVIEVLELVQPSCGAADGRIFLTSPGFSAFHSWQWSDGPTTQLRMNLGTGFYTVTLTDGQGCTAVRTFELQGGAPPEVRSVRITMPRCAGESNGTIAVETASPADRFRWMLNGQLVGEGPRLTGLPAGFYRLWITNAAGCTTERAWWLPDPRPLTATARVLNPVSCGGTADGAVQVLVSGGTLPYRYSWSTGAETAEIFRLRSGTYTAWVRDANGCPASSSVDLLEPHPLRVSWREQRIEGCGPRARGVLEVAASGGQPPYTVKWSDGGAGLRRDQLPSGTYSLTLTDALGCQTTLGPVALAAPSRGPKAELLEAVPPRCRTGNDGRISVRAVGGTPAYTFAWSTGATTSAINNLEIGIYTLTLTDARGCADTFRLVLAGGPELTADLLERVEPRCAGEATGRLRVAARGGIGPYAYRWTTGATEPQLTGLAAGSYRLEVRDAAGCVLMKDYLLGEPPPLNLTAQPTSPTCASCTNGRIQLRASGGSGGYTFKLGSTSNSSGLFTGLGTGSYTTQVVDGPGCERSLTVALTAASTCGAPSGVVLRPINPSSLQAEWPAVPGATGYQLAWQKHAASSWVIISLPASATQLFLTGLLPNTLYLVRVRTRCGEDVSPWSMTASARTLAPRDRVTETMVSNSISVYPNPSTGTFRVEGLEVGGWQVELFNLTGERVPVQVSAAENGLQVEVPEAAAGVYRLQLTDPEGRTIQRAVILTR